MSAETKLWTLELQAKQDGRFGEIAVSRGLVGQAELNAALARSYNAEIADLAARPPDLALVERFGVERALATGQLPWTRTQDGSVIVASSRPEAFEAHRARLEQMLGPVTLAITSEQDLQEALIDRHPKSLAARAETRVPEPASCRTQSRAYTRVILSALAVTLGAAILAPKLIFYGLLVWSLAILVAQTGVNATAFVLEHLARSAPKPAPSAAKLTRLPVVSLFVPLYKEPEIASRLVARLARLDYPSDLLDVCLVVEIDDKTTRDALAGTDLPRGFRQIVVPEGTFKTKPRALNYALEFGRGSIIGVYDAEDAPEPMQIRRVVERFHNAPAQVACLQGVLDYYNPRRNWLARCFTIEYAAWFRVTLPGLLRLGLVIPLGGTTLFFRRTILEHIGGWDAHNVTEDADLGIRLARHGYRTELIDTVTREEANCKLWPWVKQRSRWLKGYAVTWAVHTRAPRRLWRDLGPWRFFGVQLLLLGTLTQFALAPILWSFWLLLFGVGHFITEDAGPVVIWTIATLFILSEVVNVFIRVDGLIRSGHHRLVGWIASLYAYFPLATLAMYKALYELLTHPFYWDKTSHGAFSDPRSGLSDPHQV